ncbi:hypothetical protein D3C80_823480 [compost metagenome]
MGQRLDEHSPCRQLCRALERDRDPLIKVFDPARLQQPLIQIGGQGAPQMIVAQSGTQQWRPHHPGFDQRCIALEYVRNILGCAGEGRAGQCFDCRSDLGSGQAEEAFAAAVFNLQQTSGGQTAQVCTGRRR